MQALGSKVLFDLAARDIPTVQAVFYASSALVKLAKRLEPRSVPFEKTPWR